MTADKFRRLALSFADTTEGEHMGHPDFRVDGRIFATLGPDGDWGMIKLPPERQSHLILAEPDVYRPASGAWGRAGATLVTLRLAKVDTVREALETAWRNTAPKHLMRAFEAEGKPRPTQGTARTSESGGLGKRKGSSNSSPRKRDPR